MYLKRHASSRHWKIPRKHGVFITRPATRGQDMKICLALSSILTEMLRITHTTKEASFVVRNELILINGKRARKHDYAVGLLDVLAIPKIEKFFVMGLSSNNRLELIPISQAQAQTRVVAVRNKVMISKNNYQLTTSDGHTYLVPHSQPIKVGDSVMIDIQTNKIVQYLAMKPGAHVRTRTTQASWSEKIVESIDRELKIVRFTDGGASQLRNVIVVSEDFLHE